MSKGHYQPLTIIECPHELVPVCFTSYVHPDIRDEYYVELLKIAHVLEDTLMINHGL